jgi:uncharacterized protein (TIGR02421 family)
MSPSLKQRIRDLDARLIEVVKPINVLKHLNWPDEIEEKFLGTWRAGLPALPKVELHVPDWSQEVAAIDHLANQCEGDDDILRFLRRTAWSYAEAGRMLMAAGTAEFTERSIRLYGRPNDVYETQSFTGLEAAKFLLEKTDHLLSGSYVAPLTPEIPAMPFAERLQKAIDAYFLEDKVSVIVDEKLSSKAIAGTTRIRVRKSAMFSELDFDQLYQHEALIHTATAINGGRQSTLKCLALSAPRTTRTQEGLAVFAELATRSIDIARLRRLALRILAIKAVLDGADFIDCFKLFLSAGQDEREAYKSAQRIFRGGDVRGGIAFTKDSAYLKGVMETHVLMNLAIRDNKPMVIDQLFAGRMTMSDAIVFGPYFESGLLDRPRYVPPWARDTSRLAATLAYSSFMMNINLTSLSLDRFVQAENRLMESV